MMVIEASVCQLARIAPAVACETAIKRSARRSRAWWERRMICERHLLP
ncbi:hypothetical protein LVQ62_09905 [Allobranchiibius sp. GilTou73]|nr:hypothetical protein [Allobranchiibius sp. GilTou73]UIJ33491.1 hypothetical protein LVQ62_09905 [Allobranchiibius sp. GilTou73]